MTHTTGMRWRDYVLVRGQDLSTFWRLHCQGANRKILFIVGRGFDPRTPLGLESLVASVGTTTIDLLGLEYVEDDTSPPPVLVDAVTENWATLQSFISSGTKHSRPIRFKSVDGRRIAARNSANVISQAQEIAPYSDVVIDISAMPRSIYFPLVSRILYYHDQLKRANVPSPNIHLLVSEDPDFDSQIHELEIDETASFLHPFEGEFNREASGVNPRVWIPVLGEGRTTQFDRIYDLVKPDEVCPVLPSPSRNPRRGDDIVMEYRNLLFDQLSVDPKNAIYASEFNPFELYRQIRRAALHYHEVLALIGGCRVAFSPLCSKLMSLGILLAAYEMKSTEILKAGIAHIECQSYELPETVELQVEQVGLWIAGECYG